MSTSDIQESAHLSFDERIRTELKTELNNLITESYAHQVKFLNLESIDEIIKSAYSEILHELKRYSKILILDALGIKLDSWGHINEISNELHTLILKNTNIEKLKMKFIQNVSVEIEKHLESNSEFRYNNIRILKRTVDNSINTIHKEISRTIENEILAKTLKEYKSYILEEVNKTPLVLQHNIRKL